YVSIHSPDILPDMFGLSYHRVIPDKKLTVRFTKMIELLRPPPYQTRCFHYDQLQPVVPHHRQPSTLTSDDYSSAGTDLSLYRSQGECFLYCMWRRLATSNSTQLATTSCVNF